MAVLDPDVVLRADTAAGPVLAAGARDVAGRASMFARLAAHVRPVLVNGVPGVLAATADGAPMALMAFTVVAGRIVEIDSIADPERLAAVRPHPCAHRPRRAVPRVRGPVARVGHAGRRGLRPGDADADRLGPDGGRSRRRRRRLRRRWPAQIVEIAGPREENLAQLATMLIARRGTPVKVQAVRNPDDPDADMQATGGMLPGPGARLAGPTFEEWLDQQ